MLVIMAPFFEYFDLVAIWVLDKKEACKKLAVLFEFLDRERCIAERFELAARGGHVISDERIVAIAITVGVWLNAVMVMCQLKFEIIFRIPHINKREIGKVELMRDVKAEAFGVELFSALRVKNPNHRVNNFWH